MQIIVKMSDIIEFYKQHLRTIHKQDFNAFQDFYHESENGVKTGCKDSQLMGMLVRFKQQGDKDYFLEIDK